MELPILNLIILKIKFEEIKIDQKNQLFLQKIKQKLLI
jgi:hypothetical protein